MLPDNWTRVRNDKLYGRGNNCADNSLVQSRSDEYSCIPFLFEIHLSMQRYQLIINSCFLLLTYSNLIVNPLIRIRYIEIM